MNNKIEKFQQVPLLTAEQIAEQVDSQINFLKAIYPFLEDDSISYKPAIEIRPLQRGSENEFVRSYYTWDLSDKSIHHLKKFFGKVNGKPFCVYYSVFFFDSSKVVVSKATGKRYQKGRINNENALGTFILAADFDGMSYMDFLSEKAKLLQAGLDTIDIFTGHGYQSVVLLNDAVDEKNILQRFTKLLSRKGLKVDPAIVDAARIMRMPFTFNCKTFDPKSKYYNPSAPEVLYTTIINWTGKRYSYEDVFEKIENSLPDISIEKVDEVNDKMGTTTSPIEQQINQEGEENDSSFDTIKIESVASFYNHLIDTDLLQDPIRRMLVDAPDGYRNDITMFIIPFFRNSMGVKLKKIKEIMCIWAERCTPILDREWIIGEVERIYGYGMKSKYGKYTEKLANRYGYIKFDYYSKDNSVIIPNRLFDECNNISDGGIRIYLTLKLAQKMHQVETFYKSTIVKYTGLSARTIERNLKSLVRLGFISKSKKQFPYAFYITPYFESTNGFTTINTATLELMLERLSDGELKLYGFINYYIRINGKDCYASQRYIAKSIGKKGPSSISKMTDNMQRKHFITKKTEKKYGVLHCTYTLNY